MGTDMMRAPRRTLNAREARRVDAIARDMLMFEEGKLVPPGRVARLHRYVRVNEEAGTWERLLAKRAAARKVVDAGGR